MYFTVLSLLKNFVLSDYAFCGGILEVGQNFKNTPHPPPHPHQNVKKWIKSKHPHTQKTPPHQKNPQRRT